MRRFLLLLLIVSCTALLQAQVLINENFDTGIPATWTIVNGGGAVDTWFGTTNGLNGNTLNGSQFAFVNSDAAGNAPHPLLSEQLISPAFNGNGYAQLFLEFDHYYRIYSNDRGYVEVFNGSTWVILATISANVGAWNAPQTENFNITPYANANMQVRFRYEDNAIWAWWWAVDNVKISAPFSSDAALNTLTIPSSQCGYSTTESIEISGQNNGISTITSLPVHYQVNGGGIVSETIATAIPAGSNFNYTFTTTTNLSTPGLYSIKAWTSLPGDGNPLNDSLQEATKNHLRITTFPYEEDFESSQGGWFRDGVNPTWAWGTPAKNTIQGAGSGQKAWVTGGLGTANHGNDENNQVEGPCFDLTSLTAPWAGMDAWWNSEFSWDGANFQTSIDSGQTWQTIGIAGNPYNWYTDNTINGSPGGSQQGWSGRNSSSNGSNGWLRSVHNILNVAGQSEVLVRINFGSDGSVTDDGFAFDRFSIANQPVVYLGPDTTMCDSFYIDAGPASSWAWSTGDTTRSITPQVGGTYAVTVTNTFGFPSSDAIIINQDAPQTWNLGNDTILCNSNGYLLSSGAGLQSYLWQDGSTNAQLIANASGSYWVTALTALGCPQTDTVNLTFSPLSAAIALPSDTLCRGTAVQFFDASAAATSWNWNFGNGNLSTNPNPTTIFTAGGTFNVSLQVSDGICNSTANRLIYVDVCTGIASAAQDAIHIYPNPANESFSIEGLSGQLEPAEIRLFDMTGKLVYHSFQANENQANRLSVGVASLPAGIYLIEILLNDSKWTGKLSVQH